MIIYHLEFIFQVVERLKISMKNKKITCIIILLYIVLLFAYPYILGRNVSDINGSLPFFDKIVQNTNLIPFNFNYDIDDILYQQSLFLSAGDDRNR